MGARTHIRRHAGRHAQAHIHAHTQAQAGAHAHVYARHFAIGKQAVDTQTDNKTNKLNSNSTAWLVGGRGSGVSPRG